MSAVTASSSKAPASNFWIQMRIRFRDRIMSTGETVQRLAGQIILRHLALELDAVGAVGPWASILRKPGSPVNCLPSRCPSQGAHSTQRVFPLLRTPIAAGKICISEISPAADHIAAST